MLLFFWGGIVAFLLHPELSSSEARVVVAWLVDVVCGLARQNPDDRQLQLVAVTVWLYWALDEIFFHLLSIVGVNLLYIIYVWPLTCLQESPLAKPHSLHGWGIRLESGTGWARSSHGTYRQNKLQSCKRWQMRVWLRIACYLKRLLQITSSCGHPDRSFTLLGLFWFLMGFKKSRYTGTMARYILSSSDLVIEWVCSCPHPRCGRKSTCFSVQSVSCLWSWEIKTKTNNLLGVNPWVSLYISWGLAPVQHLERDINHVNLAHMFDYILTFREHNWGQLLTS